MNNKDFMDELIKNGSRRKENMKKKSEELIRDIKSYKTLLMEELNIDNKKANVYDEEFSNIVKDDDSIYIDFDGLDSDGYEAILQLASQDPIFALSFLKRRESSMPSEVFKSLEEKILEKIDLKGKF